LKISYTEEAVGDILQAINYLNERNQIAAANLDAEISRCIERLAGAPTHHALAFARSGRGRREGGGLAIVGDAFVERESQIGS